MSKREIKRCYTKLLDSIEAGSGDALIWATNLQSAWIDFVDKCLQDLKMSEKT